MNQWWALDIETVAGPALALQTLRQRNGAEIRRLIEADKNLPRGERRILSNTLADPAKIEADAQAKLVKAFELVRQGDALDPMTAQPICLSVTPLQPVIDEYGAAIRDGFNSQSVIYIEPDLGHFYDWCRADEPRFVGFNIRDFDLPCLRLWYARGGHGSHAHVPQPFVGPLWMGWCDLLIDLGGYYTRQHTTSHRLIDYVATLLSPEAQQPGPVADYLASEFTGEQVTQAYMDGQMDKIIEHNRLDTLMVALLAVKTQAVRG